MTNATLRNVAAAAIGLGVTIVAIVAPSTVLNHHTPVLRAMLETAVAGVGTLVALLAYGRFRRSGSAADLAVVCAVALLAWVHTLFGAVPDLINPHSVGNGVSERVELWGTVTVRTIAAGFLLVAARADRAVASRTSARVLGRQLGIVAVAAIVALTVLVAFAPISSAGLLHLAAGPVPSIVQLFDAAMFFLAAHWLYRRSRVEADEFLGWISAGCVLGGFAMVNYALETAGSSHWVRPGDVLRAATVATWAMGATAEILSYWSSIAHYARREARHAVAVDLHDGLAQELALLTSYTYADASAREDAEWLGQLQATAVRALAEARRAITSLAADEPVPFATDLARTVESIVGADPGIEVDVVAGADLVGPSALERESLVRIVREAVTNAVRHGRAHHIDISFDAGSAHVLRVADDGAGFDADSTARAGHLGLASVRERADAIGASLAIRSAPGQGTTVEVVWT